MGGDLRLPGKSRAAKVTFADRKKLSQAAVRPLGHDRRARSWMPPRRETARRTPTTMMWGCPNLNPRIQRTRHDATAHSDERVLRMTSDRMTLMFLGTLSVQSVRAAAEFFPE
jgi:hypothetical protein